MPRFLFGRAKRKWRNGSRELLSVDQFRTLVLHECARCDRNSHQFTLIEMELPGFGNKLPVGEHVRKILKRIRATDEVGWLSEKSLGIFLPETGRVGATILAKDVCDGYGFQIYTYPDFVSSDKGKSQRREKDFRDQRLRNADGADEETPGGSETEHSCDNQSFSARVSITQDVERVILPRAIPHWKRAVDILGASLALVFLSPLFLGLAAYIKAVSKGPVLFTQERIGYLGRPFTIFKFRTMQINADGNVHKNHLKELINGDRVLTKLDDANDSRFIPMASLIRKSCLDELPQLLNVLKGEMSLVGPRPLMPYEAEEFSLWQRQRMHTLPGMTGLWQVSGKNQLTFSQMMRLDARYSRKAGFLMDVAIFLKTVPAITGQIADSVRAKLSSLDRRKEGKKTSIWNRTLSDLVRQFFL